MVYDLPGIKKIVAFTAVLLILLGAGAPLTSAADIKPATLFIGPSTGTFTVGSTFTLTFYVNTANQFINVVDANILFPPDKLQVVSPSTGASFINVWAIQPSYSNSEGTISFRGAVPSPGVNTSAGLISTVTFRVKSVGTATIRFSNGSKVLLNDGLGTDVLQQMQSGIYTFVLPPPSGPIVTSQTHPDQSKWYSGNTVSLSWAGDAGATGYSYVMSDEPVDTPDNIADSAKSGISYRELSNGRHYFHIKALRGGVWGGTTHYAVSIDNAPPAKFPLDFVPSGRTSQHQPVIKFFSTDAESGLDHYEIKLIPLSSGEIPATVKNTEETPFYIEAESPYIPVYLAFGRYDVYVRAFDAAGNYQEVTRRLEIVPTLFEVVQGQGIEFRNILFIPWSIFWGVALLILLIVGIIAWKLHRWHRSADDARTHSRLPDEVNDKLRQLKEFQQKYGKAAAALLLVVIASTLLIGSVLPAKAQTPGNFATTNSVLSPPVITTISRDIFNDEIFYVGGKTVQPLADVILYIQRLEDGQTVSHRLAADEQGAWFYRETNFLQTGSYLVWAQAGRGEELSPPSPQVTISVAAHAVQLGSSRFSYEAIYFIMMLLLATIVLILLILIWYHYHHGSRKHAKFAEEKAKIEESIRRGFALLRRDIEEEAELMRHMKLTKEFTAQEQRREEQLMKDLEAVKRHIGEEVWELEKLEGGY